MRPYLPSVINSVPPRIRNRVPCRFCIFLASYYLSGIILIAPIPRFYCSMIIRNKQQISSSHRYSVNSDNIFVPYHRKFCFVKHKHNFLSGFPHTLNSQNFLSYIGKVSNTRCHRHQNHQKQEIFTHVIPPIINYGTKIQQ